MPGELLFNLLFIKENLEVELVLQAKEKEEGDDPLDPRLVFLSFDWFVLQVSSVFDTPYVALSSVHEAPSVRSVKGSERSERWV